MRKETSEWSIRMLADFRGRINVDAEYQRGTVWSQPQQALLIDSIMRGFDIPKIFLRKLPDGSPHLFDVIDGKQRLTALWRFVADEFNLLRTDPFPEFGDLSGKRWSELPNAARDRFQFTNVTVSKIEDATDDEIRDLFLRLQKGNPLNAAEKRNAIAGPVRDFVVERLSCHPLWPKTVIRQTRFGWDEHSAIILELVRKGGPTALKGADLHKLYETDDFDPNGSEASRTIAVLDKLSEMAAHSPGSIRTRWGIVDLSIVLMRLRAEGIEKDHAVLMDFFEFFEGERRQVSQALNEVQSRVVEFSLDEEDLLDDDELKRMPPDMLKYHMAFAREGASKENVKTRADIMYNSLRGFLDERRR